MLLIVGVNRNTVNRYFNIIRKKEKEESVKEIKKEVGDFEKEHSVTFPEDLKEYIIKYNGGRPSKSIFDTAKEKGHVFKLLLSFNRDDRETIFTTYEVLQKEDSSLLPFASDPSGNFLCIKDGKVVLYLHETGKVEAVLNSFSEFLEKLY